MRRKTLDFLAQTLGPPTPAAGDELAFRCPFCVQRYGSAGTDAHLYVNARTGKAVCFRCGWSAGRPERLLRALGVEDPASLEVTRMAEVAADGVASIRDDLLVRYFSGGGGCEVNFAPSQLVTLRSKLRTLQAHALPDYCLPLAQTDASGRPAYTRQPAARGGVAYMRDRRRISPAKAVEHGLLYCYAGRYDEHVVFPARMFGEVAYWTTRACGEALRKSDNPPNAAGYYSKTDVLLGFDRCVGARCVFVAEGPISALAFKYGVALLGKRASLRQLSLLSALVEHGTQEVCVALDADARDEALALCRALAGRVPRVTLLDLAEGDPDDNRGASLAQAVVSRRAPTTADRVRAQVKEKCLTLAVCR